MRRTIFSLAAALGLALSASPTVAVPAMAAGRQPLIRIPGSTVPAASHAAGSHPRRRLRRSTRWSTCAPETPACCTGWLLLEAPPRG